MDVLVADDKVTRSARFGSLLFPQRSDYEEYFVKQGYVAETCHVWQRPDLARAAQRHWYRQGQVGCLFARRAANEHERFGWETHVIDVDSPVPLAQLEQRIGATLAARCEIASFLFPLIDETAALVDLIRSLMMTESILLAKTEAIGKLTAVSLQARLPATTVKAWVLGLGPFAYLPPTRQAPCTEILIRPKVKPPVLFHRVNQDRTIAHLADAPIHLEDTEAEVLWRETIRSVRRILGKPPNRLSAAKTTFCLPTAAWLAGGEGAPHSTRT